MKILKYIALYNYLVKSEKLSIIDAVKVINKVRVACPEVKAGFFDLLSGYSPTVTICGVSYNSLVNDEKMSPQRALLFLDWLKREPVQAMEYMAKSFTKDKIEPLSSDSIKKMIANADRLGINLTETKPTVNDSDIVIE